MKYKLSNYNIFTEFDDKAICYNSLNNSLFYIDLNRYYKIKKYVNFKLKLLKSKDSELFETMKSLNFIIADSVNELDLIRFRNKRDVYLNSIYLLTINPTLECNFNCWYCYEHKKKGHMLENMKNRIILHVKNLVENKLISGVSLSWFGGEPLLYFNEIVYSLSMRIKDICETNEMKFYNSITTNGYLLNENMISKIEKISISKYQITLDGNEKKHNESRNISGKPTFNKIIQNSNKLSEMENILITVRVNYHEDKINMEKIIDKFSIKAREVIVFDFQKIWQIHKVNNEVETKMKDVCTSHNLDLLSIKKSNKGFHCYADRWHQAIINYDGNVFKCSARDFTEENSEGYLDANGSIMWKNDRLLKRFSKATFENTICLKCKLLPLCFGTCSQHLLENNNKFSKKMCPYNSVSSPNEFVIRRYKQLIKEKN